jgi:hypothetical protein
LVLAGYLLAEEVVAYRETTKPKVLAVLEAAAPEQGAFPMNQRLLVRLTPAEVAVAVVKHQVLTRQVQQAAPASSY